MSDLMATQINFHEAGFHSLVRSLVRTCAFKTLINFGKGKRHVIQSWLLKLPSVFVFRKW